MCNEKADLQRKLDALDDTHLKELEQEVSKKELALKSVNTSLYAFQTFAKELCTLLGSTPLSVSNAIHIINNSGLSGDPAKAAMSLFLGYVDAATNYMESSVGGGGVQGQLTDWLGRKLNESDEDFIHRCIDTVKSITAPKQTHVKNVTPTVTYRRKR